ncbi:acyltransferase family protein [Lysinibacillus sp. FSL K6-4013]|uniref:acyltransferase family protein n=1 Tax=Lysinibacillus sp. FSL K6-4013 TaxID=2921504 RepID=UPI003159AF95
MISQSDIGQPTLRFEVESEKIINYLYLMICNERRNNLIKEWNLLRAVACLSIVFLHSTTRIGAVVGMPELNSSYQFFRILLCYATPTFIIISILILVYKYPDGLRKGFWSKRFKYIFVPFLVFGVIDAFVSWDLYSNVVLEEKLYKNLIFGDYEGYFILIIFQFYFLFYLTTRFQVSNLIFLPLSIVIMYVYLYWLDLNTPWINERLYFLKLPFLAWVAYFAIAYYIGKNYEVIANQLVKYKWWTVALLFSAILLVWLSFEHGNNWPSSRELHILPLSIAVTAFILAFGYYIPNNGIINLISRYSLGIYLLHWQVQRYLAPYVVDLFNTLPLRVAMLFIISLCISIIIIKLISLLPFGEYIIGKVRKI